MSGHLGPNGAGKTTTIKILSGLSKPSAGTARIMGYDMVKTSLIVKRFVVPCKKYIYLITKFFFVVAARALPLRLFQFIWVRSSARNFQPVS
ncbi:MAG: ATP-binding cassette domain-containing protein [Candidatus Brocadia sp.]